MSTALWLLAVAETTQAGGGPFWGKVAFASVFVALLLWLVLLPAHLIDPAGVRRPRWRSTRFWAILVTSVQIGVYVIWG